MAKGRGRSRALMLCSLAVVGVPLAACGDSSGSSSKTTAAPATTATTASAATTTTSGGSGAAGTTTTGATPTKAMIKIGLITSLSGASSAAEKYAGGIA